MIVLDSTIVNVALPSIRGDLGFSETSLAWVVNAYLLTFGGFLLLGGRLGDLYGHRRLFLARHRALHGRLARLRPLDLAGAADHRARRAGPGRRGRLGRLALADHEPLHRAGRARQGDGRLRLRRLGRRLDRRAARRRPHRRRSTGTGSSSSTSRSASPSCSVAAAAAGRRGPGRGRQARRRRRGHGHRGADARRLRDRQRQPGGLAVGARRSGCSPPPWRCSALFLAIESRVSSPLMPLALFRLRNVATANVVGVLWAAAMFAWFFLSALYLQLVLGYTPARRSASRSCPATSSWASSRSASRRSS